jgi:muramoyltetrapeptide carboxypeptidase
LGLSDLLFPRAVPAGAVIAALSPASAPQPERVEAGLAALRAQGYEPRAAENTLARGPLYFSGEPELRLRDLHGAFLDDAVRAVFVTRGGYGSNYLLEGLDLDLIAAHPKPLVGYSDLTALHIFLLDQLRLPAFYGPMLAADFARADGVHWPSLQAALTGQPYSLDAEEGLRMLRPGRAKGALYGGCLSILTSLLGTSYEPATEGKLLFLEDVNAKPYQVDRMLWQLREAGKLEDVTGIIFGEMLDCASPGAPESLLEEAIQSALGDFDGPIAIGLRSGHVSRNNVTLTFGVEAELDLEDTAQLHLLEPAVQP